MKKQHLLPLALLAATLPLQAQVNIGIDAQYRGPKISPTEQQLSPEADGRVLLDIPAYSLNIIRIRQ